MAIFGLSRSAGYHVVWRSMAGGGHKKNRAVECGGKMSIWCLRSITPVSPWYLLVGIPIGLHGPHSARLTIRNLVRRRAPCRPSTAARKYSRWRAHSHSARARRSRGLHQTGKGPGCNATGMDCLRGGRTTECNKRKKMAFGSGFGPGLHDLNGRSPGA